MKDEKDQKKQDAESDIEEIKAKAMSKCMRILRFLQLLTENHYTPMQNYLREQSLPDGTVNQKSFDFVSYISTMLGVYEKQYVNCYSCTLGYQMIETLTEFI